MAKKLGYCSSRFEVLMSRKYSFITAIAAALIGFNLMGYPRAVCAYTFSIDYFEVIKNNTLVFSDFFDDGSPPPSAPTLSYGVRGTLGLESGGKLTIDSSGAVPFADPLGQPRLLQGAVLQTNTDPNNSLAGLKNNATLSVTGIFDLILPVRRTETYGIALTDETNSNIGNDVLELSVTRSLDGMLRVLFRRLDFVGNSITGIDSALLDPNRGQIALTLSRLSSTDDAITASFYYIDSGVPSAVTTFTATADIFHNEIFTRADFNASTPVPSLPPFCV